jgi:hypothetical protein
MTPFTCENKLVEATISNPDFFQGLGHRNWTSWTDREVEGLFGIPDLVVAFGKNNSRGARLLRTFAFEMKRTDWKRALSQAFRYKTFAGSSHVVMDAHYVHRALRNIDLFERSNIGLLSVSTDGKLCWHYKPRYERPYSDSLKAHLTSRIRSNLS